MGEKEFKELLSRQKHIYHKSQTKSLHFLQNPFLPALLYPHPSSLLFSPSMASLAFVYVVFLNKDHSSFSAYTTLIQVSHFLWSSKTPSPPPAVRINCFLIFVSSVSCLYYGHMTMLTHLFPTLDCVLFNINFFALFNFIPRVLHGT